MNNNPLVCICIPNYNNEATVAETLDSLINQTYKNIIIKVFDNASTDKSIYILREYEKRYSNIRVFQNEKNIGGEGNFTKCIENMEGEYSAIYHSDDIYLSTIVEEEVRALSENNISAVFTNADFIDENGKIIGSQKIPKEFKIYSKNILITFKELIKSNMKNGNFLVCPTVMSKTKIYKDYIINWDGNNFKTATDIDIWLRFTNYSNILIINKKLIKYRMSINSLSYRRLTTRIRPKDLFLVIDDYIKKDTVKSNLDAKDYENYEYLKFIDELVVTRNKIYNKVYIEDYCKITYISIKKSLFPFRNFKYLVSALFFNIYKMSNLNKKRVQ